MKESNKSGSEARLSSASKDDPTANGSDAAPRDSSAHKSPRKRRKVNHACVYCRRSHMTCDLERPCTRCIKRNIGHLCHDEPREPDTKKPKPVRSSSTAEHDDTEKQPEMAQDSTDQNSRSMAPPTFDSAAQKDNFGTGTIGAANSLTLVAQSPVSALPAGASNRNIDQFAGFSDTWLSGRGQFHDMHNYNTQYLLAPEVHGEFNLLNDFLNTSLLDDNAMLDESNGLYRPDQSSHAELANFLTGAGGHGLLPPSAMQAGSMGPPNAEHGASISRPASTLPPDKTREFYLQAADPSGNDTPEERMQRVLKAKYDAGMLKPFNYIKGYARLGKYMDGHIAPSSKQKILRQLDRFRPKFREKAQGLTDMELIYVEMWFEKTLMEYDRVFAAMAVPACCWRRTGEIVRGNREMAELIHVPTDSLRDAKLSLHEILTEDSLVRYWEEFGTIAFDPAHDTLLTACALKSPDDQSKDPIVNCCFSFMIRRDEHKIPSLIVGNFLPHDPAH
ncbi:RNA polymerase II-specific transcription factor-like protein [Microdochium nivale]|nr:RNA polymerase II-specific transcription factor-like protein [Microdochium nivale]